MSKYLFGGASLLVLAVQGVAAQTTVAPSGSNVGTRAAADQTAPSTTSGADPQAAPGEVDGGQDIVVTGFRQSLASAQNIKRNAGQVVDSIVAEDIGKLPDNNIAEALQRVPGIQITRNRGEGSNVAIRGLTQIKTLLNGREIFSDASRDLSLENVPTELLAGVDVYKNPSSSLIEGGLGGVVNLRTRKPFDFTDPVVSAGVRGNYYDGSKSVEPQVSILASDRFDTGLGEIGVLASAAYVKSSGKFQSAAFEPYNNRYNIVDYDNDGFFPGTNADPGDLVIAPNGGGNSVELYDRTRIALNGMVQWRPSANLELFVESTYNKYDYDLDTFAVFANRGSLAPAPGVAFTFAPGTNVVQSGAYRNVSFTANTLYTDREAYTWQTAGGGTWNPGSDIELRTDLSYTKSRTLLDDGTLRVGNANPVANGPTLYFDTRTEIPTLDIRGVSSNPADYFYINSQHNRERLSGTSFTALLEGSYEPGGIITSIDVGGRYADRNVRRDRGSLILIPSGTRPIGVLPGGLGSAPSDNYFYGTDTPNLFALPAPPAALARDRDAQCAAFAAASCDIPFAPINSYDQAETTLAFYGQANFEFDVGGVRADGNVGGRWVRTDLGVSGFRTATSGTAAPIDQDVQYEDFLPSANLRLELTDGLYLRLAAAKQLTRPSFGDLSPALTLNVQTATGLVGNAGNPDLRPLRAKSYDASLEYYFRSTGYVYLSGFLKKVDGFIQTVTSQEAVNFADYPGYTTALITRPQNGANGEIKGFEVGGQTFFDFLPGLLSGFGVQANYTFVDSTAPGPIAGTQVPLIGLSKNNINTVLFYEKEGFRARIAYNWRDDFVDTTSGPGSGSLPIYAKPTGVLDASIGYNFNERFDISLDASNLTRTHYGYYFGETVRPRFNQVFDRRIGLVLRVTL